MRYPAIVTNEGRRELAEFPDCPGCQTWANPGQQISVEAAEALAGWLEASMLDPSRPIKRPHVRLTAPRGGRVVWVHVSPMLATKLLFRWARFDAGLSQADLAQRLGVARQQITKLEHPDSNPSLETLEKVAAALGLTLDVRLEAA